MSEQLRVWHEGYQALSPRVRWTGWLIIALLLVLLVRCNGNGMDDGDPALRPVRLHQVAAADLLDQRHFIGRVDALNTVDLSFQVGGRLLSLPITEGQSVKKGSVLAALDPADYQLSVREAELQLQQAERDLQRTQSLFDRGNLSQSSLDAARTDYQLRRVALDTAKRNLQYTKITAPFDALITRRLVDPFINVQPNALIVRVQNTEQMKVQINVPENLMAAFRDPQQLQVSAVFSHPEERVLPLHFLEYETEPDAVAQTYRVSFVIDQQALTEQPELAILPGRVVTVRVHTRNSEQQQFWQVPPAAVDSAADGSFRVWVFDAEQGTVQSQPIDMLAVDESGMALVAGLQGDEQIVSAGVQLLRDDMAVMPFNGF